VGVLGTAIVVGETVLVKRLEAVLEVAGECLALEGLRLLLLR
jgi:hypothetical protein